MAAVVALILIAGYVAYVRPKFFGTPERARLPTIDMAGVDPAIANLIQRTLREVNSGRPSGAAWESLDQC